MSGVAVAACSSPKEQQSATTTSSSSSSSTGGGGTGGQGGTGGMQPVSCTWTAKVSNATCTAGTCPIGLDTELRCDDAEVGAPGVRVAPGADATWVATSSANDREVYRLANGGAERQEGLPAQLTRSTMALALAPNGNPAIAVDETQLVSGDTVTYPGGAAFVSLANGAWKNEVVFDRAVGYSPVVDLEFASDGTPHVWVVTDPPSGYSHATPDGKGGWTLATAAVPEAGAWNHFTLGTDGSIVSISYKTRSDGNFDLHALVGSTDVALDDPTPSFLNVALSVASTPAPGAPTGPLFAVAAARDEGVAVLGGTATTKTKALVTGAIAPTTTCPTPATAATCKSTCNEKQTGMEAGAFALARTDDGVAWLAYVVTAFDQGITYGPIGGEGVEFCAKTVTSDASTATLHVVKVVLDGTTAPAEVMTMPVDRPGNGDSFLDGARFVDARAYGKDLAIALRTGWLTAPKAVRVIRLDTTKL